MKSGTPIADNVTVKQDALDVSTIQSVAHWVRTCCLVLGVARGIL